MRILTTVLLVLLVLVVPSCDHGTPLAPDLKGPVLNTAESRKVVRANPTTRKEFRSRLGQAGGKITTEQGHSIVFPTGALPGDTEVTVERAEGEYIRLNFYPHGAVFPEGAKPTVVMSYAGGEDVDESTLHLVYLGTGDEILETIPVTVDPVAKTVTATLDHFSGYAIAMSSAGAELHN